MFGDGSLTLREFAMHEPHPLATIQESILRFLRNREDAVLFGAQAVNAYVDESRMTQDVDILSTRARELAEELRAQLAKEFRFAARTREVAGGRGFRVYQLRTPKNRHLADIRQTELLPPTQLIEAIRVLTPEELIAQKVIAFVSRRGRPKSGTDWRDIAMLLIVFPELKKIDGPVRDRLVAARADTSVLNEWQTLATTVITPEADE